MHTVGVHKVYTRRLSTDSWAEQSGLRLISPVVERTAGAVTHLLLAQTYVPTTESSAGYHNLEHHWLRVTYTPYGGAETDIWYGTLGDQTLDEAAGEVRWVADSIEKQLSKVMISEAYAHRPGSEDIADPISVRPFNEDLDADRRLGIMSSARYHFTRDSTFLDLAAGDGDDVAYVFGTNGLWNAWRMLEALIKWHCPPGGGRHCPIGFVPVPTAAAQTALEASSERLNVFGARMTDVLNKACAAAGNLAWHVDWATSGDYGYTLPRIRIWSRDYDDRDGWQTSHDVDGFVSDPADIEALASRITVSVGHRLTDIIVVGEPIRAMFTVRYDPGASVVPKYVRGWTAADETAWAALDAGEADPDAPKLPHVYRRLFMEFDELRDGITSWKIFPQPVPGDYFAVEGDKISTSIYGELVKYVYAHPRRLLPRILTRPGLTYTSQDTGALAISEAGAVGVAEQSPTLCWYVPPDLTPAEGGRAVVTPIPGVQPLRHEPGIMLPGGLRKLDGDAFDLSQSVDSTPIWQQLVMTVACQTDTRLSWTSGRSYNYEDGSGEKDEQRQTVIIQVPGAEWWAALADTVIGIDSTGTETTVYGVIRNDLPVLKAAADALIDRHSRRLRHADLPLKTVDIGKDLGHFLHLYGPYRLDNPILTVRHSLALGQVGTQIITGKPWTRGGL